MRKIVRKTMRTRKAKRKMGKKAKRNRNWKLDRYVVRTFCCAYREPNILDIFRLPSYCVSRLCVEEGPEEGASSAKHGGEVEIPRR